MIVLDNSVLSAFVRLNLMEALNKLAGSILITSFIQTEYSKKWIDELPKWIKIQEMKILDNLLQFGMTKADYSVIQLAKDKESIIASDDLTIRKIATQSGLKVTDSLGLLKALYQKKLISSKDEYIKLTNNLKQDIYLTDELIEWALDI